VGAILSLGFIAWCHSFIAQTPSNSAWLRAWHQYILHVLPPLADRSCLLAFSEDETQQLQDPEMVVSLDRSLFAFSEGSFSEES